MKRFFCMFVTLVLSFITIASAEGLLPTVSDAYGVAMPSLGAILHRYPNDEIADESGDTIQQWSDVSEADFEAFSSLLQEKEATLEDYAVEGGVLTATIGKSMRTFSLEYNPDNETARVVYPRGTYDERSFKAESHYNKGLDYYNQRQYIEADQEFLSIPDYIKYKNIAEILESDDNLSNALKLASFRIVGGTVKFGRYEQDNDTRNGPEEIEWIVLDVNGGKSLLLSKYGLDVIPYNKEYRAVSWDDCTLRIWLNNTFINQAFTKEEKSAILQTSVENGKEQNYKGWERTAKTGGSSTQDSIFLLSAAEAIEYLDIEKDNNKSNAKSSMKTTAYALSKIWNDDDEGAWWLRSPGYNWQDAAYVYMNSIGTFSVVVKDTACIRPAFWINLESDIF